MKWYAMPLVALSLFGGCDDDDKVEGGPFTGNEIVYPLHQGSQYPVTGTVTIQENKDGSAFIEIELTGTETGATHPVHLHYGDMATPDAEIAAMLMAVEGSTGISETNLSRLGDETPITYEELLEMDAHIKVHLGESGPEKDIVLAAGNIGLAYTEEASGGRTKIAVCKSK